MGGGGGGGGNLLQVGSLLEVHGNSRYRVQGLGFSV